MFSRIIVLTCTLLGAAGLIAQASTTVPVPPRESLTTFPMAVESWRGRPGEPLEEKVLAVLGVDEYANVTYTRPEARRAVGLYVGYYGSQRQGDTIHSPLNCLPGSGWEPVSKGALTVMVGSRPITVNRYVIRKGVDRVLVLYWYQSHGRVIADEYVSRAYMVWDAMRTHRTDAALVRVIVPIAEGETSDDDAQREGVSFVEGMFPLLEKYLPAS
jgi:EpsI family protein